MTLVTERLDLVPATVASVEAELKGRAELGLLLEARVPPSWPPELYDRAVAEFTLARLREAPHEATWWMYFVRLKAASPPTLIGTCGYKGPPGADGTVEVGYGILPEFRRRGYASEATRALIARAFALPTVTRVIAETLPELEPSIGVLHKLGFRLIGQGSEESVIRFELRRS